MNAKLKKILERCLQEKSEEEILKEIGFSDKNIEWIDQIKSVLSAIGDADFANAPEKHVINGEVSWIGCTFDAARNQTVVQDIIHNFSSFHGYMAKEITEIIVNSGWSSKCSFARYLKDKDSVAPEIRELFEDVCMS